MCGAGFLFRVDVVWLKWVTRHWLGAFVVLAAIGTGGYVYLNLPCCPAALEGHPVLKTVLGPLVPHRPLMARN
jgi:hypothetical protein